MQKSRLVWLTALAIACGGWGLEAGAQGQSGAYVGGGINLNVSYGAFYFGMNTVIGSDRLFGPGFGARLGVDFLFTPQIILGTAVDVYAVIPTGSPVSVNAGAGVGFYFVPGLYLSPHALLGLDFRASKTISVFADFTPGVILNLDNSGEGAGFSMNIRFGMKLRF
jgi:hypothetical protein